MQDTTATIDVFVFPLNDKQAQSCIDVLSPGEIERANRFVSPIHRLKFIAARSSLRRIVAGYTKDDPARIVFEYGREGKPRLAAQFGAPFFNLSHSGDLAAVGISWDCEVGIDIEQHRAIEQALAERWFTSDEYRYVCSKGDTAFQTEFFRIWTRKEATLKAFGVGLGGDTKSFDVTEHAQLSSRVRWLSYLDWQTAACSLNEIDVAQGYSGAVASSAEEATIVLRTFDQ